MDSSTASGPAISPAGPLQTQDRSTTNFGGSVDYVRLATVLAVFSGVVFRSLQYLSNRSLWLDEVLVAEKILAYSFVELLHPARWGATAPGFLLLTKLATLLVGPGELALRLLPFFAGIAALFLFVPVAKRCLTPLAVPIAVTLFAFGPYLIYYSSELKPYSGDTAASLLLVLMALRMYDTGVTRIRATAWGIGVLTATTISLTAAFVAVGATFALGLKLFRNRQLREATRLGAVVVAWTLLLGGSYLLLFSGTGSNAYARAFWKSGFMPFPPRSIADLFWFPQTLLQVFRDPLGVMSDHHSSAGLVAPVAAIIAFGIGTAWMAAHRRLELAVLLLPVLVTAVASGLMLYPFGGDRPSAGRVLLFLTPMFLLVTGEGAGWLFARFKGWFRLAAVPLLALLLIPRLSWALLAVPFPRTEIKPLLEYLEEEHRPGDIVYVHYDVRHAFEHYASSFDLASMIPVRGVCARGEPSKYLEALDRLRGTPRVWILFADGKGAGWFDERRIILDYLEHVGTRLDDQVTHGASLYLYDLGGDTGSPTPYWVQLPVIEPGLADGCALWN